MQSASPNSAGYSWLVSIVNHPQKAGSRSRPPSNPCRRCWSWLSRWWRWSWGQTRRGSWRWLLWTCLSTIWKIKQNHQRTAWIVWSWRWINAEKSQFWIPSLTNKNIQSEDSALKREKEIRLSIWRFMKALCKSDGELCAHLSFDIAWPTGTPPLITNGWIGKLSKHCVCMFIILWLGPNFLQTATFPAYYLSTQKSSLSFYRRHEWLYGKGNSKIQMPPRAREQLRMGFFWWTRNE